MDQDTFPKWEGLYSKSDGQELVLTASKFTSKKEKKKIRSGDESGTPSLFFPNVSIREDNPPCSGRVSRIGNVNGVLLD